MKLSHPFLVLIALLLTGQLLAQTGTIRGTISDGASGEPLMFTNVLVKDTDPPKGVQTDLDGNYQIEIEPGTYDLEVTYIGYTPKVIAGVEVTGGEVTIIDFLMEEEAEVLEEVVVQAARIDRTENALLALQRKASTIQDGISAQEISRYGSANAAESMQRVTGASVVDGKYVYVRGLGDRYSSAQLNGQELPSTDPYRNSTQLDLIPSNLLDNVIASKSFTPDLPGSFTGGNVDIKTKSFPDRFTMNFSVRGNYNTIGSFQDDFLTHEGGSTDWLSYDDGTRAIPGVLDNEQNRQELTSSLYLRARSNPELANLLDESSKSVNPQMAPNTTTSGMDYSVNFSIGNQFNLGGHPLGVLAGINYRRGFDYFSNGSIQNLELPGKEAPALNNNFDLTSSQGVDNPQVGALVNLAYKFGAANTNKLNFNFLYNHDAEKLSSYQFGPNPGIVSGNNIFETRGLGWKERGMQSYQLNGEHVLTGLNNILVEWGGSYVNTSQDEPDLRFFANSFDPNISEETQRYFINPSEYDLPFHFWRGLEDQQYLGKLDISIPFAQGRSLANKIKVGGFYRTKSRDFFEDRFQYQDKSRQFTPYQGDADAFFGPDNIGIIRTEEGSSGTRYISGLFLSDETRPENSYTGEENVTAGYGMITYDWPRFKVIAGARVEHTDISVISADTFQMPGEINVTDVLPSLNLIYKIKTDMNLRASFSQTLARPNMRELAPFAAFDFIGGFIYNGNPELNRTLIQNYDLRWELYPSPGELFAVSGYYKSFDDPIIRQFLPESQNPEIKFQNVDNATVYGLELEMRKKLGFIAPWLNNFKFNANLSLIRSAVDIPEVEKDIIQELNPEFGDTRPFQGQSDVLVNVGLNYQNIESGIDAMLSFNYFSERLSEISLRGTPDIYEQPRPQLDFTFGKRLNDRLNMQLRILNILDTPFKRTMEYRGEEYIITQYPRGVDIGLKLSYTI